MIRSAPASIAVLLAFLSGIPALVYQVVWTRQVGLIAGGQIEAISIVLVAFFGGLALGNRLLGPVSDRSTSPLRLYAGLEIGADFFGGRHGRAHVADVSDRSLP